MDGRESMKGEDPDLTANDGTTGANWSVRVGEARTYKKE